MLKLSESTAWPPEGPIKMFQEPLPKHAYVIGADVAEGLEHGDFSCGQVLDIETGFLVCSWHDKTDPDLFGEALYDLGRFYNTALIGVEINSIGHTTITSLRKRNYPRLFRRRVVGQITQGMAPQYGWHTNHVSKGIMIADLGAALREGAIDIRDEHTLAELRTYIREYTAAGAVKTHGSPHDDRVMALAIAVQMLNFAHVDVEEEKVDDTGTFDWWMRQIEQNPVDQSNVIPVGHYNTKGPSGISSWRVGTRELSS